MTFKLPRLPEGFEDQPVLVRRYWDLLCNNIETTLNAILNIPEIQSALATLNADVATAQAAATTAQSAATTTQSAATSAQSTATAAATENSIVNSYPSGFTPPLLSADSTGHVTVANHQRVYGDSSINPTVSVTGATITTTATSSQVVRVYYDDHARAGGAVTYAYTIDPANPPVQGGDRHVVGAITIPASGTVSGNPVRPPGWVDTN